MRSVTDERSVSDERSETDERSVTDERSETDEVRRRRVAQTEIRKEIHRKR